MNTPVLPLTSDHACACGEAAVWATRRGPQCDGCPSGSPPDRPGRRPGACRMTGPEHYAEAERLLKFIASEQNAKPEQWLAHAALAQVHATLALTAATIETVEARGPGDARAHRRQVLL